jgi:hypothetical protein
MILCADLIAMNFDSEREREKNDLLAKTLPPFLL